MNRLSPWWDTLMRLRKGVYVQGTSQFVNLVIRLSEVPLFLGYWGTERYGEWLILTAIPTYLAIGDGGFANAACREMAIKSGAGDQHGVLVVFQSTFILLIVSSVMILFVAIGVMWLYPIDGYFTFNTLKIPEIETVLIILLLHVLVGFQGGLINGGFWVAGRYPFGLLLDMVIQLSEFSGLALALIFGAGPIGAATGYLAGRFFGTGLLWIGQCHVSPWLQYGYDYASFAVVRRLIKPALASLAFPIGNAMNIQGLRILVGLTLGPANVAVFTTIRTLSRLIMQPRAILSVVVEPEMAVTHGKFDADLMQALFLRSCQLALWGCAVGVLILFATAEWIFPIWTNSHITLSWSVLCVLVAAAMFNVIWFSALIPVYATNRHIDIAIYYSFIYGLGSLVIAYLLVPFLGLIGIALGLLVTEILMTIIVLRASLIMLNISLANWIRFVVNPPFIIIEYLFENFSQRDIKNE